MTITYQVGDADNRPWGSWSVLDVGERYAVKRIQVSPHGRLSLQAHRGRDEHWFVVSGCARVTRGDEIVDVQRNEGVWISCGTKHRVENVGDDELVFIEVQTGANLDENDIVRFEDDYGRS